MIFSIRYYEQTYTNEPDPVNDNFLGGGFSSPSGPNVIIADINGNESLISNVRQFTITPGQN